MSAQLPAVLEELYVCLELLGTAGDCYHEEQMDEMLANLSALSPRLQRAIVAIESIVGEREKKTLLDVDQLEQDLDGTEMTWGYTRTEPEGTFVADEICIAIRDYCEPDLLSQLDEAPGKKRDSTGPAVMRIWNSMREEPRLSLKWDGAHGENAYFVKANGEEIVVDAGRLALLRRLTSFEKAEHSYPGNAVVLIRDNVDIAILLVGEINEKD